MTLNSSANIVSVLKQKMIDNKSQVEKFKEEIAEKENYYQVCTWKFFRFPSNVKILGGNRTKRNCQYRGLSSRGEGGGVGGGAG